MCRLVFAMAHRLIAEPDRQDHFAAEHGGPPLHVGAVFIQAPGMIVALGDSALDGVLEVAALELMLALEARDHAKAQAPAGARTRQSADPRRDRFGDERRLARRRANPIERGAAAVESRAIAGECKQILSAAQAAQWLRARCAEDHHPGAIVNQPARHFARSGYSRGYLAPGDRLEAGLRLRDIDVRRQADSVGRVNRGGARRAGAGIAGGAAG